ncbi:hypothetical protein KSZ57_03110 [Odoribacter splanchnicus]|uniref:hypothetical protein n=1 Tax=Odoribacter TaxID=283168 RepID=UPI000AE346D8|nr:MULTISPECIES: hypothetical protein [Odoribacter]MBV4274463.1 hypothetical protein [Odoribacter splanchnicus]MBV4290299.1 hypothetical protein [Odoribacter splanchnicus]
MNLKYILIVWGAMLFCVGCSEDDVDSSYSFDVARLKATVTNDKGSVVEMNTILLDSLQQQGFVGEVSFSEETRAENDRLAEEKFAEKLENIKNIKPARLLQLLPGERVMVTFDYLLKRGKDVLEEEEITLDEAIAL